MKYSKRFVVLAAVNKDITVFSDVTCYSFLKMDAEDFSLLKGPAADATDVPQP
jgi:hypothetical protein